MESEQELVAEGKAVEALGFDDNYGMNPLDERVTNWFARWHDHKTIAVAVAKELHPAWDARPSMSSTRRPVHGAVPGDAGRARSADRQAPARRLRGRLRPGRGQRWRELGAGIRGAVVTLTVDEAFALTEQRRREWCLLGYERSPRTGEEMKPVYACSNCYLQRYTIVTPGAVCPDACPKCGKRLTMPAVA